ncbi:P-loop containing nucleoside triphosphate hydrolase protein [Leucogyrophana mollusca]|uniref:P-loop containing nucleoside triphosphate hydrolase protein n=1 Tax=Leucogyrophana mollusca TaxID=85980 RepID=A0ACB8BAW6_9AGAM|nr:P-loop containing nucleoside triphosphate hydrolase protein [Leucogyrophana mollusca]
MTAAEPSVPSQSQTHHRDEQTVLILVGLIASGKSTFAQALEEHFPQFRRCNQDDLGSRIRVEDLARRTLREGLSVCVDRTNFDPTQRSYWIKIAREFPGTSVCIIVFDTPYQLCVSRLKQRASHPTIKDPLQGFTILERFASDFQAPSPDEGYDHILYLRPSDHPYPEYTRADISSILERLRSADSSAGGSQPPNRSSFVAQGDKVGRVSFSRGGYNQRNFRSSYRGIPTPSHWRGGGRGRGSAMGHASFSSSSNRTVPQEKSSGATIGTESSDKRYVQPQGRAPRPPKWE